MISGTTIAIAAALVLFHWYRTESIAGNLNTPTAFAKHPSIQLLGILTALIGTALIVVNFVFVPYQPESAADKIKYGKIYEMPEWTLAGHEDLLEKYPDSIALHFDYIEFLSTSTLYQRHELVPKYSTLRYSTDTKKLFLGQIGTALAHAYNGSVLAAENVLNTIPDSEQPYVNYVLGTVRRTTGQKSAAITHFEHEIETTGFTKGAYRQLGRLLYDEGQIGALHTLLQSPEAQKHIGLDIQDEVYFRQAAIGSYVQNLFRQVFTKLNLAGGLAAFLVMLAWLFYVRRLDIYEPEPWKPILITLALGMLFTYFVFPITDLLTFVFEFGINGEPLNDFLYCWFAIGVPEELVKIIPVLLLLKFTKRVNEPYDYILYGSVAALGFAFTENLLYYQEDALTNISARALSAVVAHMFFTSIVTYGMLLNKYKLKRPPVLNFLFFFAVAAAAHGFYDFWLINEWAQQFAFVTVIFFLLSIHFWTIFKSNALNNSTFYDPKVQIDNTKLKSFIVVVLVGIVLIEYLLVAYSTSPAAANENLVGGITYSGFLIFYIASNFSKFKIQRGKWNRFKIKLPFSFFSFTREDERDHTGLVSTFYNAKENPTTIIGLPALGRIIGRKTVNNDPSWFLVELEVNLGYPGLVQNMILIRAKNKSKHITNTTPVPVEVMLIPSHSLLAQENIDTLTLKSMGVALSVKRE
jgi:RsiW-degrading membrane proteinase PrsW (M82 family)